MPDLTNLDDLAGTPLTPDQIRGVLAQIDLDIVNLLRDGKLAAARYSTGGPVAHATDRAAALEALLQARRQYQELLDATLRDTTPGWEISHGC